MLEVGPLPVIQRKTEEKDGYKAVQLGFEEIGEARAKKVISNATADSSRSPRQTRLPLSARSPRRADVEAAVTKSPYRFNGITKVDVIGTSKGKGFQEP